MSYNHLKNKFCVVCGTTEGLDVDHVKTRGSGGLDVPENCMTLCRYHHTEKGSKGVIYMAKTYPNYLMWLKENGWEKCELTGKWRLFNV